MSIIIDRPAAFIATPRPRTSFGSFFGGSFADCLTGARLLVADAQPRLTDRLPMTAAAGAWRLETGSSMRAFVANEQDTKAGRTVDLDGAYVTSDKQHSIRSGPPTSRP